MVVVDEEEFQRLPGMIALLRAAEALARGDMPETVKNARMVLDLAPADAHLMLGGAASQLGLAAWTGGGSRNCPPDDCRWHGRMCDRLGISLPPSAPPEFLADIQIAQGHLHEAMSTYKRALQWATKPGMPVQRGAADMYVGMSDLYREHNDLKAAMKLLLTSEALGELGGLPPNQYRWCAVMGVYTGNPRRSRRRTRPAEPGRAPIRWRLSSECMSIATRGRYGCGWPKVGWVKPWTGRGAGTVRRRRS